MIERWEFVFVNGEKTRYQISTLGRLASNGVPLSNRKPNGNFYSSCSLRLNLKYHATRIHRLVAVAFIPNPNNLPQVNHIDGDKTNNTVYNLEWCTCKHNIIHSFKLGLLTRPKGDESHLYDKGRKVLNANTGEIYSSVATAARALKIPRTTISAEILGYRPNKYNLKGL